MNSTYFETSQNNRIYYHNKIFISINYVISEKIDIWIIIMVSNYV